MKSVSRGGCSFAPPAVCCQNGGIITPGDVGPAGRVFTSSGAVFLSDAADNSRVKDGDSLRLSEETCQREKTDGLNVEERQPLSCD